jgi:hypothetical protein
VQFPQALIRRDSDGSLSVALSSHAFELGWHTKVLAVCEAFSADPPATTLPAVLFVQRLDRSHLLIVRSKAEAGTRTGPSQFHVLVANQKDYAALQFDPFLLAESFEPNWSGASELLDLEWHGPLPPRRTIADVQQVLRRENGPELLGGCQALLDGSHLLFIRLEPDLQVIRDLWALLPYGNRLELMPATYAWNNKLKFDVVVASREQAGSFAGYMREEQAGGYPEGRYELSLQTAAESEDQESLDILWGRRSRREVWRLGFLLVAVLGILALAVKIMTPTPKP